jgi:putative ATPase
LTQQIIKGIIPSIIFWGPPGTKNHIGTNYCTESKRPFYILSAINSGVKDIRDVIEKAKQSGGLFTAKSYSFIDEIHRFSKSQQDSLLGP